MRCRSRKGRGAPFGVRRFSCDARRSSPSPRLQLHHTRVKPRSTRRMKVGVAGGCWGRVFDGEKEPGEGFLSPRASDESTCETPVVLEAISGQGLSLSRRGEACFLAVLSVLALDPFLSSPPKDSHERQRCRAAEIFIGRPLLLLLARELKTSAKK